MQLLCHWESSWVTSWVVVAKDMACSTCPRHFLRFYILFLVFHSPSKLFFHSNPTSVNYGMLLAVKQKLALGVGCSLLIEKELCKSDVSTVMLEQFWVLSAKEALHT